MRNKSFLDSTELVKWIKKKYAPVFSGNPQGGTQDFTVVKTKDKGFLKREWKNKGGQ